MSISRRDFLNGAALAVAAGLTPAAQLAASPARYPPALTGLRGQHAGSFEAAHALAREGRRFDFAARPIEERYDLVVVGAGLSGLSAAWFYRRKHPAARILILDNHDDFGGHARRNEFTLGERRIIGYGGSQSFQSPNSLYGAAAKELLGELGIDIKRFETAFDATLYPSLGLSRGLFFSREAFGRDVLVPGDAPRPNSGETARQRNNARPLAEFVADFPISAEAKAQYLALYAAERDPLPDHSAEQKRAILRRTSYRDYLTRICGCGQEVADIFQGRTLGFFGLGADAVPAEDVRDLGYPGFAGLGLGGARPAWSEPYIYHFPDGNASLARLLVRSLVPAAAPGRTMDDVVTAAFDYGRLDTAGAAVRLRLDSTCLDVRNAGDEVHIGYARSGVLHRVAARHAVLACFHMVIPHIMRELAPGQREALAKNVKAPIVYTNVVVRNWRAFVNLKVSGISAPMAFHHQVSLDFPVSMGGYSHTRDPDRPICLHLVHVPGAPNQGLDARAQYRIGQGKLYAMRFADFEARIRDDLDRMLGPGGFSSARDIAAITVNRWPHGYSYAANSLFDPEDYNSTVLPLARRKAGRVAIANTDSGGDAWVHYAIDQAARAVDELAGSP
jgi:spermidine dehydrogenase